MAGLLESDDTRELKNALLGAWEKIQELERTLNVATTLMVITADDIKDYLERPFPNVPPVLRKAQQMKEYAQRVKEGTQLEVVG